MFLVLDIETIPTQRQDVKDYIAKTVKHPGTLKKKESIEEWYKNELAGAVDEAVAKTGLDGAFGQICVIGYAINDNDPESIYGLEERDLLIQFNKVLDSIPKNMHSATTLVGHNAASFDVRFIWQRYIVNKLVPHPIVNMAVNSKSWDNKVFDTMTQFAGYGNRISLEKLCLALNIESPKGEIDGSMVGKAVADGRIKEVSDYCIRDVVATRNVYRCLTRKENETN